MSFLINPYRFAAAGGTLLLDETGLGSAHAAYSVARKLRDAYAGSCIRVRRSSDSTEQDIGFSSDVLDESALTTFVGANDGHVVTIYDQSGNGLNVTQATTTKQSKIVSAGSVVKTNGKPALQIGATDFYYNPGGAISSVSTVTMFTVSQTGAADGTSEQKMHMVVGASLTRQCGIIQFGTFSSTSNRRKPVFNSWGDVNNYVSSAANTNQVLIVGRINGTALSAYEDGGAENTATLVGSLGITVSRVTLLADDNIPAYLAIDGSFQEGVSWHADKNSEVATLRSNVNGFYSIY